MENKCCYCGIPGNVEALRPYGPGGRLVCFPCGTSPEHEPETRKNFLAKLDSIKGITVLTDKGPVPFTGNN